MNIEMAEYLTRRERIEETEFRHEYERKDMPGAGFSFPCREDGTPILHEGNTANWNLCQSDADRIVDLGIKRWTRVYWQDASIRCDRCRSTIWLTGFTNTCDRCGADYNQSGQLLAPRSQWGEETGESVADILSIR